MPTLRRRLVRGATGSFAAAALAYGLYAHKQQSDFERGLHDDASNAGWAALAADPTLRGVLRSGYTEHGLREPHPLRPSRLGADREATIMDVCVIGAGFAGLHTALALAERGHKVVVVEARRVGSGASGRNGGEALTGFAGPIDDAAASDEDAVDLMRQSVAGLRRLRAVVERYGIQCDFTPGPAVSLTLRRDGGAAHSDADDDEAWHAAAEHSFPAADWMWAPLSQQQHRDVGWCVPAARYALVHHDAASVNPMELCFGLARAVEANGGVVLERAPVVRIQRDTEDPSRNLFAVETRCGDYDSGAGVTQFIRARQVVLCTNAAPWSLNPRLAVATTSAYTTILTTTPLPTDALDACLAREDAVLFDDRTLMAYFRRLPGGRLLFGSLAQSTPFDPKVALKGLVSELHGIYPSLADHVRVTASGDADVGIQNHWQGVIHSRWPEFPLVGFDRHAEYWHALGFGGHGVVPTVAAAAALAEAVDSSLRAPQTASERGLSGTLLAPWQRACERWLGSVHPALPPSAPLCGAFGALGADIGLQVFRLEDWWRTGL